MECLLRDSVLFPARTASVALDEQNLIAAARAGNCEAFNQLMQAHQGRMYSAAYYLLGEAAPAADAVQEAMIAAYRSLHSFRNGSFRNWLLRIVSRKCYDILRDVRRRRALAWDDFTEDDPTLASHEDGPEVVVQRRELARRLEATLAALPWQDRQVVVLSDIQGLSYQEIAEATSNPVGTVKSRLSRARSKLREQLRASPAFAGLR